MGRRFSLGMLAVACAAAGLVSLWDLSVSGGAPLPPPPPAKSASGKVLPPPPPSPSGKAPVAAPVVVKPAPPPKITQQAFLGSDVCFECHREQAQAFSATKHSQPFTGLAEQFQKDPACLKCHVTALGDAHGYGTKTGDKVKDLAHVGCETCHGPGALHENAARRLAVSSKADEAALEKEMRAAIVKTPSEHLCATCHTAVAHGAHPTYPGMPAAKPWVPGVTVSYISHWSGFDATYCVATGSCAPAGTTIKACAACHYAQYRSWNGSQHANLPAVLPPKYVGNKECAKCHTTGSLPALAEVGATAAGHVGVGCELCHGPAQQHVAFARQFIGPFRLASDTEKSAREAIAKGKPAQACIECHQQHAHKEHPKFDKP